MGYTANGSGHISFKEKMSKCELAKVKAALDDAFEYDAEQSASWNGGNTYFDIWGYDKYHDDVVFGALNRAAEIAEVADGEICYIGEDSELWRIIFRDGSWVDESGEVYYGQIEELVRNVAKENGMTEEQTSAVLEALKTAK